MLFFKAINILVANNFKQFVKKCLHVIYEKALRKAAKEQGLMDLAKKLEEIVPDITDQYTTFKIDTSYLKTKVRNLHVFQISLVNEVIGKINNPTLVDIGDSCGTHLQYLAGLYSNAKNIKCLSVNLDKVAVEKIKGKGIKGLMLYMHGRRI